MITNAHAFLYSVCTTLSEVVCCFFFPHSEQAPIAPRPCCETCELRMLMGRAVYLGVITQPAFFRSFPWLKTMPEADSIWRSVHSLFWQLHQLVKTSSHPLTHISNSIFVSRSLSRLGPLPAARVHVCRPVVVKGIVQPMPMLSA